MSKEMYTIQIPMQHLVNTYVDPIELMQTGEYTLTFNECLGLLTDYFISKYGLFPLRFNQTNEFTYEYDNQYLYLSVPKDSVETRELKEGEHNESKN